MKINLTELSTQQIESTGGDTTKMRLSENAQSMVFQLFTKNVYSNPIGTVVREITSNCFDSHVEAGVDKPVLIKKHVDNDTGTKYISFIDYGVGMSPDRIKNVYGVYFESTKRIDNKQIGGYGIGAKSVLAYKRSTGNGEGEYDNSFYVITIFNKRKYYYCIYEGTETPVISLLHDEYTDEGNGTEIRVPVLDKDMSKFHNEMIRQLYYFENIIFEGFDDSEEVTNDYQIIRGNNFLHRGYDYSREMHVCLGRVAYPIDYGALGLDAYNYRIPVAIKLDVGEIGVTVSRESLDYSEKTIKVLKNKLELVKEEMKNLLIKQYEDVYSLEEYFKVKSDFGKLFFNETTSINLSNLITVKDIVLTSFKYNAFSKFPSDKALFDLLFNVKRYGEIPSRSKYNKNEFSGGYDDLKKYGGLLHVNDKFNRIVRKQSYLRHLHDTFYIISKKQIKDYYTYEYSDLFRIKLSDFDDDKYRDNFIKALHEIQDEYLEIIKNHSDDYDNVQVPEDFSYGRKGKSVKDLKDKTIVIEIIGGSKKRVRVKNLVDSKFTIFYGTKDDYNKLRNAKVLFRKFFNSDLIVARYNEHNHKFDKTKGVLFCSASKVNQKYFDLCKNAHHVDKFYWKMLYRKADDIMLTIQAQEIIIKYDGLEGIYVNKHFTSVNENYGKVINIVVDTVTALKDAGKYSQYFYVDALKGFYNIDNIQPTEEQKNIMKKIDELLTLQERNRKIMDYINIPYNANKDGFDDELTSILKKVMVF